MSKVNLYFMSQNLIWIVLLGCHGAPSAAAGAIKNLTRFVFIFRWSRFSFDGHFWTLGNNLQKNCFFYFYFSLFNYSSSKMLKRETRKQQKTHSRANFLLIFATSDATFTAQDRLALMTVCLVCATAKTLVSLI